MSTLPLKIITGGPAVFLYDINTLRCRRCPESPGRVHLVISERPITPYMDEQTAVSLWHRVRLAWKSRAESVVLEYVVEDEMAESEVEQLITQGGEP